MSNIQNTDSNAGSGATKRLLGKILVDGEFIAPDDLTKALEQQRDTNEQLGAILVRRGVLDSQELKAVLSVQRELATLDDAVRAAAGTRLLMGELLLKAKRLTKEQIDGALVEQKRSGRKLGEVLVHLGLLKQAELDTVLAFQRHQEGDTSASDKLRLGEILVATGQVSRSQLEDALGRQKASKKKIGDLLVEAGHLQPQQVEHCLHLQQKLVTAALVAALSLSAVLGMNKDVNAGQTAGTAVTITASIREHTSLQVLSQAPELVVTNDDISRGYVEASAATRISVKSNNPKGYLLAFEVKSMPGSLFNAVIVRVGGREVQLPPAGGWVPQVYVRGGVTQDVSYRFTLSPDVQPGTYVWPLQISVNSL